LGTRGVGFSRTMRYSETPPGFSDAENRRSLCLAMIETPGGLADVEAIASLETVDGVFVGPSDLSMTRGRGAFAAGEEDLAGLPAIARAAQNTGKIWGLPAPEPKLFEFAINQGAALVTVSDDLSALGFGLAQGLSVAGRAAILAAKANE